MPDQSSIKVPPKIETRVTKLFNLKYPIIQAGMVWTSGANLAIASANAGILGLVGAGSMTPELLRDQIRKTRERATGAWGVNLPVFNRDAEEMAAIIVEEKVPVVFTSGGSPKKYTPLFKKSGALVAHVTPNPSLARKCEEAGVDAVVVEGFEAGGHDGRDELTTMVLVPQARDLVKIPLLAAGGIADGRQMAAAFALGAEGVQVGSRLAASAEASCHQNFKQAVVKAGEADTFLTLKKIMPVRILKNPFFKKVEEAEARCAGPEEISQLLGRGRSKLGMFEGDVVEGELEIGQVAGMIHEVLPVAEIVRRMVAEFRDSVEKIGPLARG
jgi:enoyl-[acyl-carrier protein] reductase II